MGNSEIGNFDSIGSCYGNANTILTIVYMKILFSLFDLERFSIPRDVDFLSGLFYIYYATRYFWTSSQNSP